MSRGRRWLAARHHDAPRDVRTGWSHTRRLHMPERQRMTTRLKTLFQQPELFVLAGGINPIGAKMAEALGYDAFYMSGGNTSAHHLGKHIRAASPAPTLKTRRFRRNPAPAAAVSRFRRWSGSSGLRWMPNRLSTRRSEENTSEL